MLGWKGRSSTGSNQENTADMCQIVSLTSQSGTSFTAAAEVHPAMVDSNDAKGITIPLCMLASKDEDRDTVKKFEEELKVPKHVETFDDQVHGWMAARYVPTRVTIVAMLTAILGPISRTRRSRRSMSVDTRSCLTSSTSTCERLRFVCVLSYSCMFHFHLQLY